MAVKKTATTTKSSTAAKKTAAKKAVDKAVKAAPAAPKRKPAVKAADNRVFISNDDAYWFGNGTHYQIYKKLGSHMSEENGEKGIFFAVWAPGARAVHVIGSFNGWNEDQYPMKEYNAGGIWTLFIPGLGEGELYKYCITTADGSKKYKASGERRPFSMTRPEGAWKCPWRSLTAPLRESALCSLRERTLCRPESPRACSLLPPRGSKARERRSYLFC